MRDNKGRFLPGNPGGPGRPARSVEEEYSLALREAIPPDRYKRMAERVAEHIEKTGSIRAFSDVSDRLMGKPVQRIVEPDKDMPEWMVLVFKQVNEQEPKALLNGSYIELSSLTYDDGYNNPASDEDDEGEKAQE